MMIKNLSIITNVKMRQKNDDLKINKMKKI